MVDTIKSKLIPERKDLIIIFKSMQSLSVSSCPRNYA